jgi:hypothetical protein
MSMLKGEIVILDHWGNKVNTLLFKKKTTFTCLFYYN